jgi:hypothetical protein
LSLVPCVKGPEDAEEPEVEGLLRLHAEGKFEPVPVELPELPEGAKVPVQTVAEFFKLVVGLRLAAGDDREVPFAGRWVAAKVGLPHKTVARALNDLAASGVLVPAGEMPGRAGSRGTSLFAPGKVRVAEVVPLRPSVGASA